MQIGERGVRPFIYSPPSSEEVPKTHQDSDKHLLIYFTMIILEIFGVFEVRVDCSGRPGNIQSLATACLLR